MTLTLWFTDLTNITPKPNMYTVNFYHAIWKFQQTHKGRKYHRILDRGGK